MRKFKKLPLIKRRNYASLDEALYAGLVLPAANVQWEDSDEIAEKAILGPGRRD